MVTTVVLVVGAVVVDVVLVVGTMNEGRGMFLHLSCWSFPPEEQSFLDKKNRSGTLFGLRTEDLEIDLESTEIKN